jgi:hypothetical protein
MTEEQKRLATVLINAYGSGDHPLATLTNLHSFAPWYVAECCEKALKAEPDNPSIPVVRAILLEAYRAELHNWTTRYRQPYVRLAS